MESHEVRAISRAIMASSTLLSIIISIICLCHYSAFGFQPSPRLSQTTPIYEEANYEHEQNDDAKALLTRRRLFGRTISSSVAAMASLVLTNNPSTYAYAKVVSSPSADGASSPPKSTPERDALLQAIASKSSDGVIVERINQLVPLSPLKSSNADGKAYASALDGEWKLLWYNKSDFSPLLKLPSPLRPDSYQYFGSVAEREVGEGRVAQVCSYFLSLLYIMKYVWVYCTHLSSSLLQ